MEFWESIRIYWIRSDLLVIDFWYFIVKVVMIENDKLFFKWEKVLNRFIYIVGKICSLYIVIIL